MKVFGLEFGWIRISLCLGFEKLVLKFLSYIAENISAENLR
jgi:hypothetical protein